MWPLLWYTISPIVSQGWVWPTSHPFHPSLYIQHSWYFVSYLKKTPKNQQIQLAGDINLMWLLSSMGRLFSIQYFKWYFSSCISMSTWMARSHIWVNPFTKHVSILVLPWYINNIDIKHLDMKWYLIILYINCRWYNVIISSCHAAFINQIFCA